MMRYKGYAGRIEVDEEAGLLHGEVAGLRDVVTFQGRTVEEARQAFRDSVDAYLAYCASLGRAPEKPYSGKILLRVGPALHRELAAAADAREVSLNALVERVLAEAFPASTRGPVSPRGTRSSRSGRRASSAP
jgi:predicted HicB family RNase H-like nuclease